jgi:hypothetical protein
VPTGISSSGRLKPQAGLDETITTSQRVGQAMMDKAVQSGRVTAAQVAERTFEAVAQGEFYIYSHPQALASVRTRMEDILEPRTPSDPFADKPQVRQMLSEQLRSA